MKNFSSKLVHLLVATSLILSACSSGTDTTSEEKISRKQVSKEVEVFVAGVEIPNLYLEKSAGSNSESIVKVSAQISGKVTNVNVKVGEIVQKGAVLATLGDSLNTDLVDLQYQTAKSSEQLSEASKTVTQYAGEQSIDSAQLAVNAAYLGYENALKSKEDLIAVFETQYNNSKIEVENAEISLESAKESLENLEDTLSEREYDQDDLRDQIRSASSEELPALEAAETQLENTIDGLESQVRSAKLAVELARNRATQAQIGVDQLSANYRSQFSQLNAAIENSINQYHSAINQLEAAQAAAQLQKIGSESQLVQNKSALESAQISRDQKTIKAPIAGKITAVNIEAENLVSPGQVLIQIENDEVLIISTSVNSSEARLIRYGDKALITNNAQTFEGAVTSISPTLNPVSKKVDVEIEVPKVRALPTGEFFQVSIPVRVQNTFFIPLNSIFLEEGIKTVRVVENNEVKFRAINVGEVIGDFAEVTAGLKPGEKVVTTVEKFLNEGEKVTINNGK